MILIDTSAWVEFLRATGSPVHLRVRTELQAETELASTEVVAMELLAGARDDDHRDELRALLHGLHMLTAEGLADYERAAELYRACRARGETPRKLTDCLIAAVAIRSGAQVLHADADFLTLARNTPLQVVGD